MHRFAFLLFAATVALSAADASEELLAAARKGDLPAVKGLIENGAAIEAKSPYGQTPLYVAAMSGHQEVVRYLLEKGARTDVTDTFYKAPMLTFILMRKHFEVAKMIIGRPGGNVDAHLEAVSQAGNPGLVQTVLESGKPSQTALDKAYEMAITRKQAEIAGLLKKAGAREPEPGVAVDPKVLETYAGTFKSEQFPLDIKVSVKEGKLYLQATGQPEFAPKAKSPTVFEFAPAKLEVEFDSPGSFTLRQMGRTIPFKKAVTQ